MRRRLLDGDEGTGNAEIRKWKILHEETLKEEKSNIVLTNFEECEEIEAIVAYKTEMSKAVYFTSNAGGTIYGTPRCRLLANNKIGVAKLAMEIINSHMVENEMIFSPYFENIDGNSTTIRKGFSHTSLGSVINVPLFSECSLVVDGGTFKAGDYIVIRGR